VYTISVYQYFSAAHFLRDYRGKCEKLHGHNWKVTAAVAGGTLDAAGLLVDFEIVKKLLSEVCGGLDHRVLNDEVDFFKKNNPSAENISRYIYDLMKKNLTSRGGATASMKSVTVDETETSSCRYEE
jgi:6-pyruvoyltetrahydropterin/6-carboxytetrahydropterin synthase